MKGLISVGGFVGTAMVENIQEHEYVVTIRIPFSEYYANSCLRHLLADNGNIKLVEPDTSPVYVSGEFSLVNMGGRPVFTRAITGADTIAHPWIARCTDCKRDTKVVVYEVDCLHSGIWGWCGKCDIGG